MNCHPQKKYSLYNEAKNNIFLIMNQNPNSNIESFAFNNRTRALGQYYNPNNNVQITPKNLFQNRINEPSAVIINNINNDIYQKINNINNVNNVNNINNLNNINNNNPNNIQSINGNIFINNQNIFKMFNVGQDNIGNNIANGRYENPQDSNYNESYKFNRMNDGPNGIQEKRSAEKILKDQSCTLNNPEGKKDNLNGSTDKILSKNNPQYKEYYGTKKNEGSKEFMVGNNILNNNELKNNKKYVKYDVLNGTIEGMLDNELNNGNNTNEKFDSFTGKALIEIGFKINNNNNNVNTSNNSFRDQLSFINKNLKNNYNNANNGNSNQMFNYTNAMGNNNRNNYSRNRTPSKVINGLNTEENYRNNDVYKSINRSIGKSSTKDSFSKTFFMNGNNNIELSGDQIAFWKYKNGIKF